MNLELVHKLIDGVIKNEFGNVQEFKEVTFTNNDVEYKKLNKKSLDLMDKLMGTLSEEQKDLLDDLVGAFTNEWISLCRFYFKEGVAASLTNLKFLNDIDGIECYL